MSTHYNIDKEKVIYLSIAALVPFKTFSDSEINLLLYKKLMPQKDQRYDRTHIKVGLKELGLLTSKQDGSQYKVSVSKIIEIGLKLKFLSEKHKSFDITGIEKILVKSAIKKEIIKP